MSKHHKFFFMTIVSALCMIPSLSWAACIAGQVNNKKWTLSATDSFHDVLITCDLSINGSGGIGYLSDGCFNLYPQQPSFNSRLRYDLKSGTVTLVNPATCLFEINLVLRSDGADSLIGRVVLDTGKTVGLGHFFRSYSGTPERGAGQLSVVRVQ
jgi:hypothetical protein